MQDINPLKVSHGARLAYVKYPRRDSTIEHSPHQNRPLRLFPIGQKREQRELKHETLCAVCDKSSHASVAYHVDAWWRDPCVFHNMEPPPRAFGWIVLHDFLSCLKHSQKQLCCLAQLEWRFYNMTILVTQGIAQLAS